MNQPEEVPTPESSKDSDTRKALRGFGKSQDEKAREDPAKPAANVASILAEKESQIRIVYAARSLCLCGERLASPDGANNWQCSRILLNNGPTKACIRNVKAKVYPEGSEELQQVIQKRKEDLGLLRG
jgi:hypothetical protein